MKWVDGDAHAWTRCEALVKGKGLTWRQPKHGNNRHMEEEKLPQQSEKHHLGDWSI